MDKWVMFRNYMHNELGITKEDIRQWIEDAVERQAEVLVKNEFKSFDVHKVVQRLITDDRYFGSDRILQEIRKELAEQIIDRIDIKQK